MIGVSLAPTFGRMNRESIASQSLTPYKAELPGRH